MCIRPIVSHSEIGSGLLHKTGTVCTMFTVSHYAPGLGLGLHNETGTECVPCPLNPTLSQAWGLAYIMRLGQSVDNACPSCPSCTYTISLICNETDMPWV